MKWAFFTSEVSKNHFQWLGRGGGVNKERPETFKSNKTPSAAAATLAELLSFQKVHFYHVILQSALQSQVMNLYFHFYSLEKSLPAYNL